MKIHRRHRHGASVPTHSLNDIMFFLLLFFLIIATISPVTQIVVKLPDSKSTIQIKGQNGQLVVTENMEYFYNNELYELEELDAKLAEEVKTNKDLGVSISMDKKLKVKDLTDVLAIASKHKIRLFLKTVKKS